MPQRRKVKGSSTTSRDNGWGDKETRMSQGCSLLYMNIPFSHSSQNAALDTKQFKET